MLNDVPIAADAPPEPSGFAPLEPIAPVANPESVSWAAVVATLIAVPVIAIAVGFVWHLIGYYAFDMLLLSPLVAGIGAGAVLGFALFRARVSPNNFAAYCGIVAGLLTMLSRHGFDAYASRPGMIAALLAGAPAQTSGLPPAMLRARAETYLTPWRTVTIYTRILSKRGVRVGKSYDRDKTPNVTGVGLWGLTIVETVLIGFAAAGGCAAVLAANRRCEDCGKTLNDYLLFQRHSNMSDAVSLLTEAQRWRELSALPKDERFSDPVALPPDTPDYKRRIAENAAREKAEQSVTRVTLAHCGAGCRPVVRVETRNSSAPAKRLVHARLSPESAAAARAASLGEPV